MKKRRIVALGLMTSLLLTGCSSSGKKNEGGEQVSEEVNYFVTGENNPEIQFEFKVESLCWFPDTFKEWNPEEQEYLELYKGVTPLKSRVEKEKLIPINETQTKDFKVMNLSIFNGTTSGVAPRGLNNVFAANTFSYWQYVDEVVYWAGSAGEGIIVPPTADCIDAAHTNGTPILGTVFLPPVTFGGKPEWVKEILEKDENGQFPIVDKLISTAKVLGFDGWFINMETEGVEEGTEILFQEFIKQYKEKANDELRITWYDSLTEENEIDWQNALNEKNDAFISTKETIGADNMFLNFWWTTNKLKSQELLKNSASYADKIGVNPYDLYAGIDVQAAGTLTKVDWSLFSEGKKPFTSLGLYCPSWAYYAAKDINDFEKKENKLWVNGKENPALSTIETGSTKWQGVSTFKLEESVIDSAPFVTNFSKGNGYSYFIKGEKVSELDWNNRSLSNVLPTYRWIMKQSEGTKLAPSIDYGQAYNGGNSIRLYGKVAENGTSRIDLFSADLKVTKELKTSLAVKANEEVKVSLVLTLENGEEQVIQAKETVTDQWKQVSFDLSKVKDQVIKKIAYEFSSEKEISQLFINLGEIAFYETNEAKLEQVKNVQIKEKEFHEDGLNSTMAMTFDPVQNADYYEIFKVNDDGKKSFLGATNVGAIVLNNVVRQEKELVGKFEVVAVDCFGNRSKASDNVTLEWPDIRLPKVNFTASATIVAPGESVEFTSLVSDNTKSYEWKFEGGNIETSTEEKPKVTYAKEGSYKVTLTGKNDDGQVVKEESGYIVVRADAKDGLQLLSQNKPVEASSSINADYDDYMCVDGSLESKWCAIGPAPHTITVDLEEEMLIGKVYMAHSGVAQADWKIYDTQGYEIQTSVDGVKFETVVVEKDNTLSETVDIMKPVKARFVRLVVKNPTQNVDSAARIHEFQVFGLK